MANKPHHVLLRDGSARRGGPRPDPPARPAKPKREAESGSASFGPAYSDRGHVGVYDARKAFENAHGNPSPRQLAERGQDPGGGEHVAPDRSDEMIRRPLA
jgi:hypothetical protein